MKTDPTHEAKREAFDAACASIAQAHDASRTPMITQAQLKEFYAAQATLEAIKIQLKAADETASKLEAGLLASMKAGAKVQRGRLAPEIEESERRNVSWKDQCEKVIGKAGVEAIRLGTAPTIYKHVVVVPARA